MGRTLYRTFTLNVQHLLRIKLSSNYPGTMADVQVEDWGIRRPYESRPCESNDVASATDHKVRFCVGHEAAIALFYFREVAVPESAAGEAER